jgi:hypothetical protein
MKPQYIFIGPTKSGTTWIDHYLRSRREVLLPQLTKETFFFDKRYRRGMRWYESLFGDPADSTICVEVAPSLLGKPAAAERLAKDLPTAVVICTLRHPIDRAVSHYFHYLKTGEPDIGFRAMYERHPDLVDAGLYYKHLSYWTKLLGQQRIRLLTYDDMRNSPESFCSQLCDILGIAYAAPLPDILVASVNEAAVPKHPALARIARNGADGLRWLGAYRLVNRLGGPGLKRLAFGLPPDAAHKERVKTEAMAFYSLYGEDLKQLEEHFGVDLTRRTKDNSS